AGVGVALFAFPTSGGSELAAYFARVARYNYVLNGAANADGPDWSRFKPATPWADTCTPGPATQPVQVPIGKDGQTRLGKPRSAA
ncbi:MAG: hypothetical protein IAG13_37120, partial [Deltaproteobacteria bacterium]|nr:hypothetical protein [Nannocystaceae bacterium]